MRPKLAAALLLALVGLAAGCTPKLRVEWTRPPRCILPESRKIALRVDKDGSGPTAAEVADVVIGVKNQGQVLNKWAAVGPVRNEFKAQLEREGLELVDEDERPDAILAVRPIDWKYALDQKPDLKHGSTLTKGSGRLDVRVQLLDAKNPKAQPQFLESYWATSSVEDAGEVEAMARASRAAAEVFLTDLRPTRVSSIVELDDDDPITEAGIELAKGNRFDAAYEAFSDAVAQSPKSGPALYDLAIMAEVRGEYDEAEKLLGTATKAAAKPLYYSALERVRRARKDAEAMRGK
jgi:tetratricopeptide (TPR) repeat protein